MNETTKERRTKLIGEVKRLVEVLRVNWADAEPARPVRATEVIGLATDLYATYRRSGTPDTHEVEEVAALEADGADKAGRIADGGSNTAQGVDGGTADGNAAVVGAESEPAEGVTEACFCVEFAFRQFLDLVLSFGKPVVEGGNFGFECIDAPTAKKRANALHGLVARIKEFRNGDDFGKLHAAIIAHAAMRG